MDLNKVLGEEYMKCFEGLSYVQFLNLRPRQIKDVIPQLGPRMQFENLYQEYIKQVTKKSFLLSDENVTCIEVPFLSQNEDPTLRSNLIEGDIITTENLQMRPFESVLLQMTEDSTSTSSLQPNSEDRNETPEANENSEDNGIDNEENENSQSTDKIEITVPGDLNSREDILALPSIELKIIVAKCTTLKAPISNYDRVIVGKEIIRHVLESDLTRVITNPQFQKLARLIVETFPKEKPGPYYIPTYKTYPAQGKLYSAYTNYKTSLRAVELIEKRNRKASKPKKTKKAKRSRNAYDLASESEEEKSEEIESEGAVNISPEAEANFQEVKFWDTTFQQRQKLVGELSLVQYVEKYPMLNLSNGYEMLVLDTIKLHGDVESQLPEIASKIITYAVRQKKLNLEGDLFLAEYLQTSDELDQDSLEVFTQLTAIKLLPHLRPNPKKKLGKSEVANKFVPYFKTAVEAEHFHESQKRTHLLALQLHLEYISVCSASFHQSHPTFGCLFRK